ncbi:MAG: hypothetical protein FJX57_05700, partial [Alphaproteobacteria bacterium]|nr:hypothetical protein [Alphaproteobacteria bacterium]
VRVPIAQVLASPGLLTGLDDPHNAVATGHLLYGLTPVSAAMAADLGGFRPALRSIVSRLVHLGQIGNDAAAYLRGRSGALGVIPLGIAHGYRPTPGESFVIVGGARAPVLRPCLEGTVIDLSQVGSPALGMAVTLLGTAGALRVTLDDLAAWQRTSPLALLTGLTKSLHRRYVEANPPT